MLALTKKTGYGLIALGHLASLKDGQVASAASIANLFGVPRALLMNVLKELAAAGFVQSVRGAGGGYRLARRPRDIRLAELTGAVEKPVRLAECVTKAAAHGRCTRKMMADCPVADPVHRFHRKLNDFLQGVTLEEILNPFVPAATENRAENRDSPRFSAATENRDSPHFPKRKMGTVPSGRAAKAG